MKKLIVVLAILAALVYVAGWLTTQYVDDRYNRVRKLPPYAVPAATAELHRGLFIADLHADTLLWGRNLLKRGSRGHIDLPRLQEANVSLQAFTVVTTIPKKLNIERNAASSDLVRTLAIADGWPPRTWSSPKQRALYQAKRLRGFEADSKGQLSLLRTRGDVARLLEYRGSHTVGVLLGAEGAQPLEGDLRNLDELYAAGFRMMAPTHFTDTEIAGSASGESRGGLTQLGRQWVREMESRKMLIDLAHASRATVRDVTAMATRPVIVSHTGVTGTCANNRNLSDDELRAVAATGGVIGIGYWDTAVCGKDAVAIARAIVYTARLVGAEHVALGSDFDGAITAPFDVTGIAQITDALRATGLTEQEIRLVMGENVARILQQTLPEH